MPKLIIDNLPVEVPAGATILDAARKVGIDIPTLCLLEGRPAVTSCMVCVVRLKGRGTLVPSCGYPAQDGLEVESETEFVRGARRAALELLLGDHLGDCEAPCQGVCPAHLDIPRIIRRIAAGDDKAALEVARDALVLPAALGRICPAPCQRGCRRAEGDGTLAIRLLHRFAADAGRTAGDAHIAPGKPSGKAVAVVGAGPAGLAAAYRLLAVGHACTIFDDHDLPGGMLRYGVGVDRLPHEVLDAEIAVIERLGAKFRLGVRVGAGVSLADLRRDFDAVFLAPGKLEPGAAEALGVEGGEKGVKAAVGTGLTSVEGVFAGGDAVAPRRMAVRAVADGKAAAEAIGRLLRGEPLVASARRFNSRIGRLLEGEMSAFMAGVSPTGPVEPAGGELVGLTEAEARSEAARCLHCDCRKGEACKLREYAEAYGARQDRPAERRRFGQQAGHPDIIYEPGKCILCGICVRIATEAGEELGLSFIGRGFNVRVAVPFAEPMAKGLRKVAAECVRNCPTGALAFKADS